MLCLALLYLGAHSLPRAWKTLNTDFPNYYMSARLAREGFDTARMYEWPWIEREKDHRALDIRVIGLLPITPFSTLAVWPLVRMAPLTAKHVWILLNLGLLVPMGWMLRLICRLSYRRVVLVLLFSFPLQRNLLFGQFYIVLLFLIVAALWCYLRGHRAAAGALVAIAAAFKVFPVLLFLFFLQRRDWHALSAGVLTGIAACAASIAVFGLAAHRTWLEEILPWVMHGEGLQPYSNAASISGILHRLLLSEPQWNPHPWHESTLAYALLAPTLQTLVLAPAILLIRRSDSSRQRVLLEWCALITAALSISTIPASYNFVIMALPVCVLATIAIDKGRYVSLAALVGMYLGIGYPMPSPHAAPSLSLLLYNPRLPLMLILLGWIYLLLLRGVEGKPGNHDWSRYAWAAAMILSTMFSIRSTLHLERAERSEYAYRLPLKEQGFVNAEPQATGHGASYAAFTFDGYQLMTQSETGVGQEPRAAAAYDYLSFTANHDRMWAEKASSDGSQIVDVQHPAIALINDARDPMLSEQGQLLAFIHDDHGRGRLMIRLTPTSSKALTPDRLNVYEASFLSEQQYAFAATENGGRPEIEVVAVSQKGTPVQIRDARYPALSPDGHWLAYSHLNHGVWNLWLLDRTTGIERRIADVPCNQIEPSWESDGKTLLYGTDCGRSIWFTAVAQRRVVP